MTDNVVLLDTKRSISEERELAQKAEEKHQEQLSEAAQEHKNAMLTALDNIRQRVEAGELDGLAIAGRNPGNGAFLSTIILNSLETRVDHYLAYAGILSAMQIDMTDLASAGPHMNTDGSYFALGELLEVDLEDDE